MADSPDESLLTDSDFFAVDPPPSAATVAATVAATATATATAATGTGTTITTTTPAIPPPTSASSHSSSSRFSFVPRHSSSPPLRDRDNSLGGQSASTDATTTTLSSILHLKIPTSIYDTTSSSSLSGGLPPPSIFELGDSEAGDHYDDEDTYNEEVAEEDVHIDQLDRYEDEALKQLEKDRILESQDSDSETDNHIATPKLDTPTTTPTAEKFNPIDFLTRSSSSTQDHSPKRHPSAHTNFLELPSPSKYAADLESERSSLTPDCKREDSVYFTAAWASPKETPSSVKSEPSFSPDRDRLSPVGGFFNGQQAPNNSTTVTAGNNKESLTPPVNPVSAGDADLFVTRLRESIWKSAGKNKKHKNKTVRDFTQDWLSQFLTGVPRTERNNWLSDDEASTQHSEKGEAAAEEEEGGTAGDLLGIDDFSDEEGDDDRDDGTSTTLSYKTLVLLLFDV
ncbi:hypothetical protein KEM56_000163 [Ascosphaera pollenicola]|nr:hypothetical protein KEM56_000163 [Ascosphaera pollenicola]